MYCICVCLRVNQIRSAYMYMWFKDRCWDGQALRTRTAERLLVGVGRKRRALEEDEADNVLYVITKAVKMAERKW